MDSSTLDSCPSAEHMTTRAAGSIAMISFRAARPSFLGHRDVEGRHLGLEGLVLGDGLDAVPGLAHHLVPSLGQRVADHLPHDRGIVDYEDTGHLATSPSVSLESLEEGSTLSMRTAQSPSTTTRRPVANRRPLTNRSMGSSGARSSSTTAPWGSPTTSAVAWPPRPSWAHTGTEMPASDGAPCGAPGEAGAEPAAEAPAG